MAKAKKTKAMLKAKKKWVGIFAPKVFNSVPIGETYIYETREGIGKAMHVNMMVLTKNPKKQGVNVKLLVTGQHDGALTTDFIGLRMMPPVVRRMVRRGKDKIEDSFIVTTLDGKKVRVKPLIIARSKINGSIGAAMRKAVRMYLAKAAAKLAYDKLVEELVDSKLQKGIHESVAKLYPVSVSDIRWFELVKMESVPQESAEQKKEEAKAEE